MAESWRAKANRYARGDFTNAELKVLLGGMVVDQVIDIATYGRLSQLKGKAFKAVVVPIIRRGAPIAGRALMRTPLAAAGSVRMLALRHPVATAAAVIYVGYHERERIKQLLDQGYDIIEERLPTPSLPPSPGIDRPSIPGVEEILTSLGGPGIRFPIARRPSKFNQAVSAGMKAIKKSTSYGGKGKIKPAKKAFSVVVKLAAAKKKKKKAPKSGIRRRIWNAMKGLQ